MTIFGINFNDFGSRKLRIDSQKNNANFNGIVEDTLKEMLLKKYAIPDQRIRNDENFDKYAVPSQPAQIMPQEKPVDDAPTIKYGIPSENFKPYVNINPPTPIKPVKPSGNEPPMIKYAVPPRA